MKKKGKSRSAKKSDSEQCSPQVKGKVIELCESALTDPRITTGGADSKFIDYYKILRTQIMQKMNQMNLRTLVITSSVPGEGKTITALNLSMSFAKILESSVILVEADLHRPALQAYLKYEEPMKGLADYLLDDVPVGELLVNPGIPKLEILFAGRTIPDSTELLASNKMKDLVKDLTYQNKNTYVIFDMTSLLEFPDALVSLEFVDAVLMVVAAEATSLDRIIEAHEKIGDKTFLGFVLNKARIDEGHLKRKV